MKINLPILKKALPWILCAALAGTLVWTTTTNKPSQIEHKPAVTRTEPQRKDPATDIIKTETAGLAQKIISNLAAPKSLATLKNTRASNPRMHKITYWLELARINGGSPNEIMDKVMTNIGWGGQPKGKITANRILSNLETARELGCLNPEGMVLLREGKAPIIQNGKYKGTKLSVDHIIPLSAINRPNTILANLQYLPEEKNLYKGNWIGVEEVAFATEMEKAGLINKKELEKIRTIFQRGL